MTYAAPQGKFAKRLKQDKDKWRAEMSDSTNYDIQRCGIRDKCKENEKKLADLKRYLAKAKKELKEARKYSMSEEEWKKLYE